MILQKSCCFNYTVYKYALFKLEIYEYKRTFIILQPLTHWPSADKQKLEYSWEITFNLIKSKFFYELTSFLVAFSNFFNLSL
jgi:hypothetical protein